MKWSILILTQPSRKNFLARLLKVLEPQVAGKEDVEIITRLFEPTMQIGPNRQAMVEAATGEYICFIDDDDLVATDYVDRIYPLLDGVDYVGFRLQLFIDDQMQKPTYHSLEFGCWNADDRGWYRDLSYMNPIRRELCLQAKIGGASGEDQRWADALRAKEVVKTEHYISDIMYFYYFRSQKERENPSAPIQEIRTQYPDTRPLAIRHVCPDCSSAAVGIAGGMRICNQCGRTWL